MTNDLDLALGLVVLLVAVERQHIRDLLLTEARVHEYW